MADKDKGYVLLHRLFWDNPLWENERFDIRSAWIYLFSHANYKNGAIKTTGGVVSVGRGQLFTTTRFLAKVFQWDKDTVTRFLRKLEKLEMITQCKSTHGTLITIVNYNKYQRSGAQDGGDGDTDTDTGTDTDTDTVGDSDSPLLNKSIKNSENTCIEESIKKPPAGRRGRRVLEE